MWRVEREEKSNTEMNDTQPEMRQMKEVSHKGKQGGKKIPWSVWEPE